MNTDVDFDFDEYLNMSQAEFEEKLAKLVELEKEMDRLKGVPTAEYDKSPGKAYFFTPMAEGCIMTKKYSQPSIVVFAGPNGSGKSTITKLISTVGIYVNADDIQKATNCDVLTAAQMADAKRNETIDICGDLTFETVLSTDRNLKLLQKARSKNYFIRTYYVLTRSSDINVTRVKQRVDKGGHDVPKDKIRSRYERRMKLIPEVMEVSDIFNIYDNSDSFVRIFSKKHGSYRVWATDLWSTDDISALVGIDVYKLSQQT